MQISARRRPGVPECCTHRRQIRAAMKRVRCVRMTQEVWRDGPQARAIGSAANAAPHAPSLQPEHPLLHNLACRTYGDLLIPSARREAYNARAAALAGDVATVDAVAPT